MSHNYHRHHRRPRIRRYNTQNHTDRTYHIIYYPFDHPDHHFDHNIDPCDNGYEGGDDDDNCDLKADALNDDIGTDLDDDDPRVHWGFLDFNGQAHTMTDAAVEVLDLASRIGNGVDQLNLAIIQVRFAEAFADRYGTKHIKDGLHFRINWYEVVDIVNCKVLLTEELRLKQPVVSP